MNTAKFERKLTAILSADVEGYSRLMRDDEDETVRTITAYRTATAKLVEQYRGRVVDSPGDNILSEFGSSVDAVNCAVEVQRELAERNAELSENRKMRFRIGVNSGDVVEEGERIYGDGVNIASRIEGLAEGGGICISGTVYDSIEGKLGLEFENLGEHEVKNIDKPIRVYRVLSYPGAAAHRVVKAKMAVGKSWRNVVLAIAAVLILGGGALAIWTVYLSPSPIEVAVTSKKAPAPESSDEMPPPVSDEPSIAVLPFANISGDPKEDYLSDGITEQIITALSKTPRMLVIARNSVFTYKGKPVMVQQVSEELGVRYVLEESVQKEGDRVRITAQLIDAKTGNHLWADRYDREVRDLFELQDDITKNVTAALQVKLTAGQTASSLSKGTKNLEAYLKLMKGLSHHRRYNKNDNEMVRLLYEEAIALDPKYSNAFEMLAWSYKDEAEFGWTETPWKSYEKAMELAEKAISLDEQNGGAYMVLAQIYSNWGQFEKAMAAARKALSLDPADSFINASYGVVLNKLGKFREAIPFLEKAIRIDPKPQFWFLGALGWSYYGTGQFKKAIPVLKEAIRVDPKAPSWYLNLLGTSYYKTGQFKKAIPVLKEAINLRPYEATNLRPYYLGAHVGLAAAYSLAGRMEDARAQAAEVLRIDPEFSLEDIAKNGYYNFQKADKERFINALRKAGLK